MKNNAPLTRAARCVITPHVFCFGAKSRDMVAVGQFGASKPPLIRTFLASGSLLLGISRVAVVNLGQNHVSATACGRVGKKPAACCCVEYSTSRVNHVKDPRAESRFWRHSVLQSEFISEKGRRRSIQCAFLPVDVGSAPGVSHVVGRSSLLYSVDYVRHVHRAGNGSEVTATTGV